jgi:hypothetical protein
MLALSNEENEILLVPDELGALKEGLISAFPSTPAQFPIRNKLRCPNTNEAAARVRCSPLDSTELSSRGSQRAGKELEAAERLGLFASWCHLWLLCWVGRRCRIMAAAAAVLARLALPACGRGWWSRGGRWWTGGGSRGVR